MTTVDDPMPLQDALRILRNVSEHNTREIPSPGQVAEAVGVSIDQAVRVAESLDKLSQKFAEADCLIRQASSILGDVWGILQDLKP